MITWENVIDFVSEQQDKYIKDVFHEINPNFLSFKFSDLIVENYEEGYGDICVKDHLQKNKISDCDYDLFCIRGGYLTYLGKNRWSIYEFPSVVITIATYGKEDLV